MGTASSKPKSIFRDFRFLGISILGGVSVALVSVFGSIEAQIAMFGTWLSILAGLIITHIHEAERTKASLKDMLTVAGVFPIISERTNILQVYVKIAQSIAAVSTLTDPVLLKCASGKLDFIAEQVDSLANGEITFNSTEAWRATYEQLLSSKDVKIYRSVAWVKSVDYWQDEPGKKSLQLNLDLAVKGLQIHRIVIVRDTLWPIDASLPLASIMVWIAIQQQQGIKISLLKESDLLTVPELCRDMGIYGSRAVGVQDLDERCRTIAYTLNFDSTEVHRALARWQGLSLYARQYEILLGE